MAWSYDGDPTLNQKDAVRWLVGDTNQADQLASDEEIWYAIAESSSTKAAAALVADAIAASLIKRISTERQVGRLRLKTTQRAQEFRDLATNLRSEGGAPIVGVWVGGTKISEKQDAADDADRIPTYFERGAQDYV